MIILYGGGPGFGLPEISPYATKTEVQLQMAGLAYRKQRAAPNQSPKGQLPFIDDEGELIADSAFIRAHLEGKYDFDLDEGLSPVGRAQAWAVERMLENHFGWAIAYVRWIIPENFEKGPARFFDAAPEEMRAPLRSEVCARVAEALRAVGLTRHAPEEILALADRTLAALSELLGAKTFLFGERPAGVDATAFAMLAGMQTPFFDSPLQRCAADYANLGAYVRRMMARHYPRHPWPGHRSAPGPGRSTAQVEQVD